MKSAAQNQVLHQLKLMESNLREIQCKLVKTSVLNLWQIVLPDGKRILLEHAGGGHWIFRSNGLEKSHLEVRKAVLRTIGRKLGPPQLKVGTRQCRVPADGRSILRAIDYKIDRPALVKT